MDKFEKTSYETNPVESPVDAICAFVEAYDVLQTVLAEFGEEIEEEEPDEEGELEEVEEKIEKSDSSFADELREAMYRPVLPNGDDNPPISIYEIGVVYVPGCTGEQFTKGTTGPDETGKYGVNNRKLKTALRLRENDVRALFVQEDGILPHLCEMLPLFLENELHENVYAAALRFLNECRRLIAMWE